MTLSSPAGLVTGGVRVQVKLNPKSSRDEIFGIVKEADGRHRLLVRVKAPPVDGAANEALIRLLAERLGIARRAVEIMNGECSRLKTLKLVGDGDQIIRRLAEISGPED